MAVEEETTMNANDENRISEVEDRLVEVEKGLEVLVTQFEDYRDMQDVKQEATNNILGELKEGQANLVLWHMKNLEAVNKATFKFLGVTIAAIAATTTVVGLIMKFVR